MHQVGVALPTAAGARDLTSEGQQPSDERDERDDWDDWDDWDEWLAREPLEPSWQVTDLLPDHGPDTGPLPDPDGDTSPLPDLPLLLPLPGARPMASGDREWPPPQLVDSTDPGPLLAALVTEVDLATCSDEAVVGLASAAVRLQSWASSVEVAATATLVERAGRWRGVTPSGRPVTKNSVSAERICAAELAAALGLSERAAANRIALAQDLGRLPGTTDALARGRLHLFSARMVVEQLRPLDDDTAATVEAKVLPRYAGRCHGDLARALRRAVLAADPAAAERRRERAAEDRTVQTFPLPDGMAAMEVSGPAEDVEAMFTFVTASAEAAKGPADTRTLDQRRFDVLADLAASGLAHDTTRPELLWRRPGRAGGHDTSSSPSSADVPTRLRTRQGRRPTIHVVVSIETLLGLRDDPGELAGYGPITAETARRIATEGTWRRLLTDPRTGRFDELSADTYEPPQDMRDHVVARDPVCIGIGCRLPANRCDLDHRVPHPRGPTSAGNLEPWCRSGHEIKTFTDTEVVDDPAREGGRTVTYPSGRSYPIPVDPVLEDFGLDDDDVPPF